MLRKMQRYRDAIPNDETQFMIVAHDPPIGPDTTLESCTGCVYVRAHIYIRIIIELLYIYML